MLPESCKDGADVSPVHFYTNQMARAYSFHSDRMLVGCFKSIEFAKIFNQRSTTVDLASIDRYNSPLAGVERPREMVGEEFSERRINKRNLQQVNFYNFKALQYQFISTMGSIGLADTFNYYGC